MISFEGSTIILADGNKIGVIYGNSLYMMEDHYVENVIITDGSKLEITCRADEIIHYDLTNFKNKKWAEVSDKPIMIEEK